MEFSLLYASGERSSRSPSTSIGDIPGILSILDLVLIHTSTGIGYNQELLKPGRASKG
jgi:hypothetical protein